MRLSDVEASRDNNFNLVRLLAASGVFASHCFSLSGYSEGGKPQLLGFISVNVFFVVSGFLVSQSLFRRGSVSSYLRSRALRIFPALILAVVFTVFVVGALMTTLPVATYLGSGGTLEYAFKNIVLLLPAIPDMLPGLFQSNPQHFANGPLWTLPYELWMYVTLAAVGGCCLALPAHTGRRVFVVITVVLTTYVFASFVAVYGFDNHGAWQIFDKDASRLFAMFGIGVLMHLFSRYIPLGLGVFVAVVAFIALSSFYRPLFVASFYGCLGFMVLFFAYQIGGAIRAYNRVGDYSYGIYIFGYPVQQSVEQLVPDLALIPYSLMCFAVTLVLAALSWHLVESRALKLK